MPKPQVTVIITVRNEEATMDSVLNALLTQTRPPAEVVIIDSASTDRTVEIIQHFGQIHPHLPMIVESFRCNRSTGRNRAIELAHHQLIAITDAGCLPRPEWLAELVNHYDAKTRPVVAGYAVGCANSPFQQALLPYFLVMPDRVTAATYLPATRSMLIDKTRWEKVGKFNESLNTSEDYVFAKMLLRYQIPIVFAPKAEVEWQPPTSLNSIAQTFFSFAAADIQGGVWRPKVIGLFGRYGAAGVMSAILFVVGGWPFTLMFIGISGLAYALWAISKNKRYAPQGWFYLPLLQLVADCCVMSGTIWAVIQKLTQPDQRK